MKVVFLDIDGVLNSRSFMLDFEARCEDAGEVLGFQHQIDHRAVLRLNRLLINTRAVVVVSSSWRRIVDLDELGRILRNYGFEGTIIGATPDLTHLDRGDRPVWRGDEIAHWLEHHPRAVQSFVILDDGNDMGELSHRLVRTDDRVGLTDEDVLRAMKLLENP